MYKDAEVLMRHILDECDFIVSITQSLSKEEFVKDGQLRRAIERSLEIIGEASKKIPDETKATMVSIPWKNMSGMRDRLIHDYHGVNYSIVWDVVKNKIPELKENLSSILEK